MKHKVLFIIFVLLIAFTWYVVESICRDISYDLNIYYTSFGFLIFSELLCYALFEVFLICRYKHSQSMMIGLLYMPVAYVIAAVIILLLNIHHEQIRWVFIPHFSIIVLLVSTCLWSFANVGSEESSCRNSLRMQLHTWCMMLENIKEVLEERGCAGGLVLWVNSLIDDVRYSNESTELSVEDDSQIVCMFHELQKILEVDSLLKTDELLFSQNCMKISHLLKQRNDKLKIRLN